MDLAIDEIEITLLSPKDIKIARKLFKLFQEVFETPGLTTPKTYYLDKLLKRPGFVCFAAMCKGEVVGGLTAYELPMYYAECSEMFIYDIAVKPQFKRMGIGRELITAIADHCTMQGITQLFVDASETDGYALDFYRAMKPTEERVIQFSYAVK